MFCYKCKQDSYTRLCQVKGICAKDPATVAIEEFLFQELKALSIYAHKISEYDEIPDVFFDVVIQVLFSYVQNIQTDRHELIKILEKIDSAKEELLLRYEEVMLDSGFKIEMIENPAVQGKNIDFNDIIRQGERLISKRMKEYEYNEITLIDLLMLTMRGIIKNVVQAKHLGIENPKVKKFFYDTIFRLTKTLPKEKLIDIIKESGKINLIALEDFERGLEMRYGVYESVNVRLSSVKGKSILISGRDIHDLENILKFTESKDINVYTHGEMLLAHTLPELSRFKNLVGHYGGISLDQQLEIESFPGPVLVTSNCAWNPPQVFRGRIFTTGIPVWMGVKQLADDDFMPLVNAALDSDGFTEDDEERNIEIGFNAKKFEEYMTNIKDGIDKGLIKHVFLLVGCSSSKIKTEYMTEFVENLPKDAILIKFAGLYSEDEKNSGKINGVPRILDFGFYNDLFFILKLLENGNGNLLEKFKPFSVVFFLRDPSAISILVSLAIIMDLNDNIKIDTCIDSMLSPSIFKAFENNFGIKRVASAKEDINDFLG